MLKILLLGPPQQWRDNLPLTLTRRKSRALLYYLAAHETPITREHLLSLLWPDLDRPSAQQSLRTLLHGLRKALGPAIQTNDDTIALTPDVDRDTHNFATYLTTPTTSMQQLTTTLERYRGDFLDGFLLPDSESFEDWMMNERERYRQITLRGLVTRAQRYESEQQYHAALDTLTRATNFDPLQEDIQRACMRMHYLAGDRAGAIRRYEHLRKLLDTELGVPPMTETRALYDAIVTDTLDRRANAQSQSTDLPRHSTATRTPELPPRTPRHTPAAINTGHPLPFVGRTDELRRLQDLTDVHQLVLIEGEPGIGKTRLISEYISTTDALTLFGSARELERNLPYQPIIEALRSLLAHPDWANLAADLALPPIWAAELGRLLPELLTIAPESPTTLRAADESRLWEGLNQFLHTLAARRPIIVVLDDVHWADTATLALLGYLVRQSTTAPITFFVTAHTIPARSSLAALIQTLTRDSRLARLRLARLTSTDTTTLARHISPTYQYPLADWLTRTAEGNPYIIVELLRYARDHALLQPDGALNLTALATSPIVPQSVYSLILARVQRLTDAARRLLDAAVAAGREFEFEVVLRAAALSEETAIDAIDELCIAGLISPLDGWHYTFDHSLTMEVAYREVGQPRHRQLHRRIAEALEHIHRHDLDAVAGLLTSHFSEGGIPDRAALYALRAARRATSLAAWQEAIAFYEQALAAADGTHRMTILMELGNAYLQASAFAQASDALRAALSLAMTHENPIAIETTQLALARAFLPQGRYAETLTLVKDIHARATHPALLIQTELLWGTALSLEGADLIGAAEHLNRAAALCDTHTDPANIAQIHFELGSVAAQQGQIPQALARYHAALEIAQANDNESTQNWQILANNNLAYHLHLLNDTSAATYAQTGMRLARERGALALLPYLLSTLGEIALAHGDLDTAEAHFTEGFSLAEQRSNQERIAGLTANLGLIAHQRGHITLAIHRLSTALARADALGTHHLAAQIRLWLIPLLPTPEARMRLAEARNIAESGGRQRLLADITRLENTL